MKEAASGAWSQDVAFGPEYVRVDGLISVTFTTERNSAVLDPPVTRLVVSCSDDIAPNHAAVWVRDPTSPPGQGL